MAKDLKGRISVGKATKVKDELKAPATPATVTLDQDEVMRAMMASIKGKARDMSQSGSDDDEEDEEEDEDEQDHEEGSDEEEESDENGVGSSSSGFSKRSRSPSPVLKRKPTDDKEDPKRSLPSQSLGTSRVKLSSIKQTPDVVKSPFDHPKTAPISSFASLGLSQPLINALAGISILKPTEIQSACVGPIMEGRDCIGGAKTGSGKTMAFALPIVQRIAKDPYGIWAVVLTPTRELAYQLTEQFLVVGKPLGLKTVTIVGGMDMMAQARELEARPHIIVATPGRLCDLLRSDGMATGLGKLGRVKTLVLDEADRLLTPTFAPELQYLFSQIPANRQTCLFTATVSEAIMELAKKPPPPGKKTPFVYRVESDTATVANLKQKYLFIPSQIRDPYLFHLLHNPPSEIDTSLRAVKKQKEPKDDQRNRKRRKQKAAESEEEDESPLIPSTIIFTQRCATAHLLHLLLTQLDVPSVPLHSHLTQPQRLESLARFRARDVPVLVTTDVGSRGLDIPSVAMVINWDCPRRSDDYIHRVGRTARAGKGGVAVTVVTERDVELVQKIEEEIGVKLAEMVLPEEEVLEKLNAVSLARRMATMEMHDSGFGERQATNKAKAIKRAKRDAARAA